MELLPDEAEGEEEGAEALKREAEECGRLFEGMMARSPPLPTRLFSHRLTC